MRNILISAYGCEPDKGSEQGVGWHWVLEMAKTEQLWVVTRSNNQESIERKFPKEYKQNVNFIYYDLPSIFQYLKNKDRGLYFYYSFWQLGVFTVAKKLSREINFDYCMHLTFGSMWMPTFMHWLPIPFIWGPIGGGEEVPFNLIKTLPKKSRLIQYIRYILIKGIKGNLFFIQATHKAKAILVRTEDSKNVFPQCYHNKIKVILETGINKQQLSSYKKEHTDDLNNVINLVVTGRLVTLKNVELAIRSLGIVGKKNKNIILTVVGDGPLKPSLIALAKKLEVDKQINFVGNVTQKKAIDYIQRSDVFVFPSLKEGGSWSLIEAMAVGLPIVCVDTSGMHVITDDDCAYRILPSTPKLMLQQMSSAINELVESKELRETMGDNGRMRLESLFLWQHKGEFIQKLLSDLDDNRAK